MKNNVHPLARPGEKSGSIRFLRSGKQHTFSTCVNDLTGSRMCWFDNDPPHVDLPVSYIRGIFNTIRRNSVVISSFGDFER